MFIDREKDSESQLGEFEARKYEDETGRFTSIDEKWEEYRDQTPYNYAENNPVRLSDPSGFGAGDVVSPDKKTLPNGRGDGAGVGGVPPPRTGVNVGSTSIGGGSSKGSSGRGSGSSRSGGGSGSGSAPQGYDGDERRPMQQQKGNATLETPKANTSRAARREAMRQQKIPTSQQPKSQSKNEAGREYRYKVDGKTKSVQQQTKDRSHKNQPHWEAGNVRVGKDGKIKMNRYNRPNLDNNKSKVNYKE